MTDAALNPSVLNLIHAKLPLHRLEVQRSTAGRTHMEHHGVFRSDCALSLAERVVTGAWVLRVGKKVCFKSTAAKETERQLIVIGMIAGHCAYKPLTPFPASDDDVLSNGAVEDFCLVPDSRDHAQKLESRLIAVMLRIVGNTSERTPVHDEEGKLLGAATHHLGRGRLLPLRRASIEEPTGCIVHGPREHAGKRDGQFVSRSNPVTELVVLVAFHALARKKVRIGYAKSGRLERAMKINH